MQSGTHGRKSIILRLLLLVFAVYSIISLLSLQMQLVELKGQLSDRTAYLEEANFKIKDKNGDELHKAAQAIANTVVYMTGLYLIPGRHVSTFIGDIRAGGTITLTNCKVDEESKCTNRWDKHNDTYNYIGQCYYVKFLDEEGKVTVDGNSLTLADCNRNTTR